VPLWKPATPKGLAYHSNLYTRVHLGQETDSVEKWFNDEFESPATDAIRKAISESQMSSLDWSNLIRFVALQDVRTPARLVENLGRWHSTLPKLFEQTLERSVNKLQTQNPYEFQHRNFSSASTVEFPVKVQVIRDSVQPQIKAEAVVGRQMWLWGIERILNYTARILHQHRWTILKPYPGFNWFTSDDPVIKLNYYKNDKYDFGGGYGFKGTEIFLPLSPEHLLYTQVGHSRKSRGTRLALKETQIFRKCIAEHSHRMIFCQKPDSEVITYRTRKVDKSQFDFEAEQWRNWHSEQSAAEVKLQQDNGLIVTNRECGK
ncbi:MAG: DUF4238 domain-containing protein, partial [Caldilineaceae bacterium]